MCVVVQGLLGRRAGLWALLGSRHAGRFPGGARGLHGSPVPCGKNLLKKFASKTKKKFWYEGPSLGPHLTHRPSQLELLTKSTSKKTKKEDHVRLRAVNGLLYKALGDLLCTPQVSQEIYDLNVELSKVSVTWDFSTCRVYWKATLSAERDTHVEAVLRRSAAQLRHLLMSQQTLRNVPPIVFIQDRGHAALAEVDRLLAVADFGPPDGKDDVTQNSCRDPEAPNAPPPCDTLGPAMPLSLSGIDHEALSRQIVEYKRRQDKGRGGVSPAWSGPKQMAQRTEQRKKRKEGRSRLDDDLSPRNYLLGVMSGDNLHDGQALREELILGHESELPEAEQEPEVERSGDRKDRGDH